MANLQWIPGLHYATILITTDTANSTNTYNTEHQTHIWHYRSYFKKPVIANKDYDYIRHTKHQMLVITPNITYSQYLELRDRFIFHPYSFITMDLSELTKTPYGYHDEINTYMAENPMYQPYIRNLKYNIVEFMARNPTYKILIFRSGNVPGYELNPQIKPEMVFDDIKYDKEGWVVSVGEKRINQFDPIKLRLNPNFYCFAKRPDLLELKHDLDWAFAQNPANTTTDYLEFADSNRFTHVIAKDIVNVNDFIIIPKQKDILYRYLIDGKVNLDQYNLILYHFIRSDLWTGAISLRTDPNPKQLYKNRKMIYLYTHPDPVKYDIDRL